MKEKEKYAILTEGMYDYFNLLKIKQDKDINLTLIIVINNKNFYNFLSNSADMKNIKVISGKKHFKLTNFFNIFREYFLLRKESKK